MSRTWLKNNQENPQSKRHSENSESPYMRHPKRQRPHPSAHMESDTFFDDFEWNRQRRPSSYGFDSTSEPYQRPMPRKKERTDRMFREDRETVSLDAHAEHFTKSESEFAEQFYSGGVVTESATKGKRRKKKEATASSKEEYSEQFFESLDSYYDKATQKKDEPKKDLESWQNEEDVVFIDSSVIKKLEEEEKQKEEEEQKAKRAKILSGAIGAVLVTACIYIILLIYGCLCTNYAYNETGTVTPEVFSVKELKEKKEFEPFLVYFERIMYVYQKILILDCRIASGIEDPMNIAPLYNELDNAEVLKLVDPINGIQTTKYDSVKMLMLTIVQDMDVYCGSMSVAITNNDENAKEIAIEAKETLRNAYIMGFSNIEQVGSQIKGIHLQNLEKFDPYTFESEYINGTYQ